MTRAEIDRVVEDSLDRADLQRLRTDNALLRTQLGEAGKALLHRAERIQAMAGEIAQLKEARAQDQHRLFQLEGEVDRLKSTSIDAVYERARHAEAECERLRTVVDAQDRLIRWRGDRIAELTADPKEWR